MKQTRSEKNQAPVSDLAAGNKETVDRSTLEEKLGFRMRMADRAIYRRFIQNVGMTPVLYSVLTLVAENEGMPQGVIGEALDLNRASTMAIMDKLEHLGWVVRRRSPVDRRRYAMYLSAKGRQKILATEKKVQETDNYFKGMLSDDQLRDLNKMLDLIRRN